MSVDAHDFFPPAAAYPLNRFLFALKSDNAARERYAADPERAMREAGLDAEPRTALTEGNRDRLVALGARPTWSSWPRSAYRWPATPGPTGTSSS